VVVFQVFQDIEHTDQVESFPAGQLAQIALPQRAVHASPSKFQFFGDQVHAEQFAVCTDLFQHAQNVAVAAADFQDSVARRQPFHNLPNETAEDGVAGAKPEVSVFRVEQEWREVRQTFGDRAWDRRPNPKPVRPWPRTTIIDVGRGSGRAIRNIPYLGRAGRNKAGVLRDREHNRTRRLSCL
jgi:hypothetical protein